MYADDTHITYASADLHSMQSSLNRDLSNIHKWLLCNKLTLNSTKTEFMLIGSRQKLSTLSEFLELSVDYVPIKQVSTTKSLGILIDDNMAWHSHIDKISKKIASSIGAIKRIKPFVLPEILHYIYNVLITVVLSGEIVAKRSRKNYKNCRIVLLAFSLPPLMMLMLGTCYNNLVGKTSLPNVKFK